MEVGHAGFLSEGEPRPLHRAQFCLPHQVQHGADQVSSHNRYSTVVSESFARIKVLLVLRVHYGSQN